MIPGDDYFLDTEYSFDGKACLTVNSFGSSVVGPNLYNEDDVLKILHHLFFHWDRWEET